MKRTPCPVIRRRVAGPARIVSGMILALMLAACSSPITQDNASVEAQDEAMALRVKTALLEKSSLAGAAIDVDMEGDKIRLSGFVGTKAQRRAAIAVARESGEGASIIDQIEVK